MAHITDLDLPNIEELLAGEGSIDIGYKYPIGKVAVATDQHQALAMLRRRDTESLAETLLRLDAAIEAAMEHGEFTDEINR